MGVEGRNTGTTPSNAREGEGVVSGGGGEEHGDHTLECTGR